MGVEPRGSVSPSLGGPTGGASEGLTAGSQVSVQLPLVDEQQGELLSPMFCMQITYLTADAMENLHTEAFCLIQHSECVSVCVCACQCVSVCVCACPLSQ